MDKKYRLICALCATCGIIGGILYIAAGLMEDAFPRPLWFVAAICMFVNAAGIILNYRYVHKQGKSEAREESK